MKVMSIVCVHISNLITVEVHLCVPSSTYHIYDPYLYNKLISLDCFPMTFVRSYIFVPTKLIIPNSVGRLIVCLEN